MVFARSCFFLLCFSFLLTLPSRAADVASGADGLASSCLPPVRIAVLAKRGVERCRKQWGALAAYLDKRLPGYSFELVPLDFDGVMREVAADRVDFVLTNPAMYVNLEYEYGASRMVTMLNLRQGLAVSHFGGVIFCRADRDDIKSLKDVAGKMFMAVDPSSLGGWLMAKRELDDAGIKPFRHLLALFFAGTHDRVVEAVKNGEVDVGTVRTDTLERMAAEGRISLADFRILNSDNPVVVADRREHRFPFVSSTRLYPEWPFARTRVADPELARQVTIALLQMDPKEEAARAASIAGWVSPLDYQSVHNCMRQLREGVYRHVKKVLPLDVARQYWFIILVTVVLVVGLAILTISTVNLNLELSRSREELSRARDSLEERVEERTRSLHELNEKLREEVRQHANARRELAAYAAELNRSNAELQQFAYVASHDLQEPLRMIASYVQLLVRRYGDRFDDEGREFVGYIVDGTGRMQSLIRDLLAYSRVGSKPAHPTPCVVGEIIAIAMRDLRASIAESGAEVIVGDMPTVVADHTRMRQLFMNLIGNAIKFRRKEVRPRIEISAERQEGGWLFAVSDNGIGIERESCGRVFEIFQRLHSREAYEGTGIGLAICRKIVESHNGRIWCESGGEGRGATFFFTLPDRPGSGLYMEEVNGYGDAEHYC